MRKYSIAWNERKALFFSLKIKLVKEQYETFAKRM